jgi:hypothetical protein
MKPVPSSSTLVAHSFVQREGIDFDDTFTPMAWIESVRLLFTLAAQEGWHVHHMDVKSAFLNGDLKEEVYVHQPPGFVIPGKEGKVLRLCKALYGLRQAPRAWNVKLDSMLKGMGFGQSPQEAAIYRWGNGGNALLVGVYINDLVITGSVQGRDEGHILDERPRASLLLPGDQGAPGRLRDHASIDHLCQARR